MEEEIKEINMGRKKNILSFALGVLIGFLIKMFIF